jgi:hypothetical protein
VAGGLELLWPGKYGPDGKRTPIPEPIGPIQWTERIMGAGEEPNGRVVLGDNLDALGALAHELEGSVDLVYIDPPFATGGEFSAVRKVGGGEDPAEIRVPAYDDSWPGGAAGLIEMLDPRIRLLHRLLSAAGSLYLHVDPTVGHAVKLLLDDVFGERCFQREIVWRIGWLSGFKTRAKNWIRNHDLIFFYVKDPEHFTFNKSYVPHAPGYRRRDGNPPKSPGVPLEDVWNANETEAGLEGRASLDSIQIKSFSREKTGFATQKNESILERIIEASSNEGDLVVDCFAGSGTTAAVASRLGRRFIVCDRSVTAHAITRTRLLDLEGHGEIDLGRVGEADDERTGTVELRIDETEAGAELSLAGVDWATDDEELGDRPWADRVEAWAADFQARSPFCADFESHRNRNRRELRLSTGAVEIDAGEIVVKVWNVYGRVLTRRVTLRRDADGLTIG